MRFFKKTAVWAALKRLAMGLGLIALFSAILLLSDLGHRKTASADSPGALARAGATGRMVKTAIVYFARDVGTDQCVQGLIDGLKASGFDEGKNLEVRRADAQGEMMNIPAILQNFDNSDVDLILTITTPCLAGACNKVRHKAVVFTCVTDPMARACARRADRTRVSESIQRHITQPHHSRESQSCRPPRPWPRSGLGIEGIAGGENA